MASYVLSWFQGPSPSSLQTESTLEDPAPSAAAESSAEPSITTSKAPGTKSPADDHAGDADGTPRPSVEPKDADDEDDGMFPARDSAQRVKTDMLPPAIVLPSPTASPTRSPTDGSMGPPAVPNPNGLQSLKAMKKKVKRHLKEAFAPGHSQMDWAVYKSKGHNLRGTDRLLRVTPSMLAQHNTKEDAWAVFFGKVYNLTPYMSYHPGGERKLIKCAGRDGTRSFIKNHEWVNIEALLDECLVGFYVPEPNTADA